MAATRHKRREWFRVLRDLMAAGVSMHKVARACGKRSVTTVAHWADGGDPKDSDARVVLALYRKHCPEKWEAHMKEYEPEVLDYEKRVWVKPSHNLRGRPELIGVQPSLDFLFAEPEGV